MGVLCGVHEGLDLTGGLRGVPPGDLAQTQSLRTCGPVGRAWGAAVKWGAESGGLPVGELAPGAGTWGAPLPGAWHQQPAEKLWGRAPRAVEGPGRGRWAGSWASSESSDLAPTARECPGAGGGAGTLGFEAYVKGSDTVFSGKYMPVASFLSKAVPGPWQADSRSLSPHKEPPGM